jgi:RNA polymerase sigma-70 factor (ECF subfamily)
MALQEENVGNQVLRQLLSRRRMLLAYIRALVRDYDLAEDIFQEVCLAVLRRQDLIAPGEGLDAYFRKIARHSAFAALEKRGRAPAALSEEVLESLDRAWDGLSPEFEGKLEALNRCVEKLPPRSRNLLRMRYDHRLTGKNLGDQAGLTTSSAYVALSRVHRALRDCVARSGAIAGGAMYEPAS